MLWCAGPGALGPVNHLDPFFARARTFYGALRAPYGDSILCDSDRLRIFARPEGARKFVATRGGAPPPHTPQLSGAPRRVWRQYATATPAQFTMTAPLLYVTFRAALPLRDVIFAQPTPAPTPDRN